MKEFWAIVVFTVVLIQIQCSSFNVFEHEQPVEGHDKGSLRDSSLDLDYSKILILFLSFLIIQMWTCCYVSDYCPAA